MLESVSLEITIVLNYVWSKKEDISVSAKMDIIYKMTKSLVQVQSIVISYQLATYTVICA